MIELAGQRRDLATVPLGEVSKLASAVAAEIGYSPGTARRELVRHVRELQAAPRKPGRRTGMKGKLTTGGRAATPARPARGSDVDRGGHRGAAGRALAGPAGRAAAGRRRRCRGGGAVRVVGGAAERRLPRHWRAARAAAAAAAAAPRPRARHAVRAVAAVGTGAGGSPGQASPAVPVIADAAVPPVADLGADRPRPVSPGAAGATEEHVIFIAPPRKGSRGRWRRSSSATRGRWWSPRPAGTCTR